MKHKLTYELSIPLTELYGANVSPAEVAKDIAMNVKINAMSKQDRSGNNGNNYAGRSGGRGGRMGGGMNRNNESRGEGTNPLQGEDRTAMFDKAELKQKFILAQPNGGK